MNIIKKKNDNYMVVYNRIKYAMIVVVAIMLGAVQLMSILSGDKLKKYSITEDVVVEHNGKVVFQGNIDNYKLKNIKSEDTLTMYMNIPDIKIINPAIIYDNINTGVKIYIDGKKIYSIGEDTPKGGIVCHAYNKVVLGDIQGKKELKMEVRVLSQSTLTRLPRVKLMNVVDLDKDYFFAMNIYIVMGIYFAIMGVVGIVIYILTYSKELLQIKILVLSVCNLVCALYIISTFQVIPIFSDNLFMDAYIEYVTKLLLVVVLNIYMCFEKEGKRRISSIILASITGAHVLIVMILQVAKIKYINDTMTWYFILMGISGIDIIIYYIKNIKSSINKRAMIATGSVAFGLVGLYFFVYLFFRNYVDYFLVLLPITILAVITLLFVKLVKEITGALIDDAKKEALNQIAFMDVLTGINNRRGLENYVEKIKKDGKVHYLYLFDLNDLKKINDTHGHAIGDIMIMEFATELRKVFRDGFCARIGGDEFIAIHDKTKEPIVLKTVLERAINKNNLQRDNSYTIKYAVGYSKYVPSKMTLESVIEIADSDMYKNKMEQKKAL